VVKQILFGLWFFLPAALANMAPIFAANLPWLKKFDQPMDFGRMFRGKRVLGSHKTWRGLAAGIVAATVVLWLQALAVEHYGWAQALTDVVDYDNLPVLIFGPLFAIGALGGDAIKSFFKRQRNTPPGQHWFPWDQLDCIIGTAVVILPFVPLPLMQCVILVGVWLLVHMVVSYVGWLLHMKEHPI
jgi:CDP-2,3-bis-(O-geranylgeranyl)-sn-glycerol synthase